MKLREGPKHRLRYVKKLRNKVYRCYILFMLELDALIFTRNCNLEGEANLLWWMQLVSRLWEREKKK